MKWFEHVAVATYVAAAALHLVMFKMDVSVIQGAGSPQCASAGFLWCLALFGRVAWPGIFVFVGALLYLGQPLVITAGRDGEIPLYIMTGLGFFMISLPLVFSKLLAGTTSPAWFRVGFVALRPGTRQTVSC